MVHPADRERVQTLLRESLNRTHLWDTEFRVLWPDGSVHWLLGKGKVFLDDSGLPVRMAGVTLDITERKHIEEALRFSQERLELAQEAAGIGIWDWDAAADETHCSSGYGPLYGLPPGDRAPSFAGWLELVSPEDRVRVREELSHVLGRADHYSTEFRVVWPDGTIHWLYGRGRVFRDSRANPIRIVGLNMDISERKSAEAALRESEERFRKVFEEGPLGVALVGKDYHFVKVNNALCRMVGYSEAELLQKSFGDITHPNDVQADVELAERLFRCEIPSFKLRKRYVKKNGEIIWIDLTASVIRDKEGEPVRLAMIEDVTEVKRAQEEALARQKLESLGVLAGGIAHDFNNLLGGILASTELALTECAEGSAMEEELQRIKTTAVRGSEIVRELMIYGGEESPTFELVDISTLVNEMLQLLKVSISKHTILKIELGQDLPPIQANPAQIRQVMMNLLTNASEAIGDRSGEIRVTSGKVKVGPGSPAPGGVNLAEGDYLRLEVSDTGRGMTPEVQARIFDPFFSTKRAGRGLGLAAVQGVIRSHGGTINVKSAPGQGSRFEILLRCCDQATQETRDITVTPPAKEPGTIAGTVLVVEDEEILRLAVSKMLRKSGFSVIEAGDGTTGLNLFRASERKIDVVLLDMTLPGMSGRELLEELRRIQPGVKVILATAFSQASALSSIDEQHLWGFVRKPYRLSELTHLLRMACLDEPKKTGHSAG